MGQDPFLLLDGNGDLVQPDRYAVSRVGADGSRAAAAGGLLSGTGTCSVSPVRGAVDFGPVDPGGRSEAAMETVVNTGTRQFGGGVAVSAGPRQYGGAGTGRGADLDAGLTMHRVPPDAAYEGVGAAAAELPESELWPGGRLEASTPST